ncbi:MAG: alkylphosphonate utilization protein [Candidatus Gastranaerophilales bacterium]
MEVKDCNGNILVDGDSVVLSKDLQVKGCSLKLKRGTTVKKIRLTSNEGEIDCKIGGTQIVLKTCFVKKA